MPLVDYATQGHVALITLADPAGRNVLSAAMLGELAGALQAAERDEQVRAIVLAAEGPVFSAGHDLKAFRAARADPDHGRAAAEHVFSACAAVMRTLAEGPLPSIAAVEGVATAAGCQLAASCDLAVAGEAARFATPGVTIGLFCSTPAVALTRTVGRKAAMEMLLTGEMIAANEAVAIGLVNRVVPAGSALGAAIDLARRIARGSPGAIARGKRTIAAQADLDLAAAYDVASRAMVDNLEDPDAEGGIDAFLEKRAPHWRDR